jgi:hypothetical protein
VDTKPQQLEFKLPRKKRTPPKLAVLNARVAEMILADDFGGRYEAEDADLPQIFFLDLAAELQIWEDLKRGHD